MTLERGGGRGCRLFLFRYSVKEIVRLPATRFVKGVSSGGGAGEGTEQVSAHSPIIFPKGVSVITPMWCTVSYT